MTAIVGLVSGGKVWIGGDSAGVNSHGDLQLRKDSKVFKSGEYLIGVSGNWQANQALRFVKFTAGSLGIDPFQHMIQSFLPELNHFLERFPEINFELLVGFRGHLFHTYGALQVSEEIADYEACGCGAQVARGAMYMRYELNPKGDPAISVKLALQAAERFCSGVRAPFHILEI